MSNITPSWSEYLGNEDFIKVTYDWNDDHSSYRLDDLNDFIKEAEDLLLKFGYIIENIDLDIPQRYQSLYDLNHLIPKLRAAIRDENIDDTSARRAYLLADELEISPDTLNDDADFAYQDAISYTLDLIKAWSKAHPFAYSKYEVEVDPEDLFHNISGHANRHLPELGERWYVKLSNNEIDINGDYIIKGLKDASGILKIISDPDKFEFDSYFTDAEDTFDVIEYLKDLNTKQQELIADAINSVDSSLFIPLKRESFEKLNLLLTEEFTDTDINPYLATLSCEWTLSFEELLETIKKI